MKKLYTILFIAVALYTTNLFAKDYVVKYENETGEIIAWGAMSGLKTSPGETIIETDMEVKDIEGYLVKSGKIVEKSSAEKKEDKLAEQAEKDERKERKQAVLAKMGLDSKDVKALIEILQDGHGE